MSGIRNPDWENDENLKADIQRYVLQNLTRREVLDFLGRDYPQYAWSLPTLSRRMAHFGVKYVDYGTDLKVVEKAVKEETSGPGQLLGYRSMHKKLREHHHLAVPRGLVYDVMTQIDPEGLESRGKVGQKKRHRGPTGTFTSLGPNHTYSGDGHDKLMDFMNNTFPLAVYGLQDVFSGYILYLKLWPSNSDPKLIGRWYLEYLYESRVISQHLRLDRGSETGVMATIHAYLRQTHDDVDASNTVHFGPSTNNKIERWWRELHNRLEKFFKRQLRMLFEKGYYDPDDEMDRHMLAFIFIPVIQKEMDIFRETIWNSHRVRSQKEAQMPKGIPNHLYSFPESYGAQECGLPVTQETLNEVAEMSGVMTFGQDFLPAAVRTACERIIPDVDGIKSTDAADTFLFLKAYYNQQHST